MPPDEKRIRPRQKADSRSSTAIKTSIVTISSVDDIHWLSRAALASRILELDDDTFTLLALHVRPDGITREQYAGYVRSRAFDLEATERNLTVCLLAVDDPDLRRLLVSRANGSGRR